LSRAERSSSVRVVAGLAILAAGLILTLDHLHYLHADDYLKFWPLILITIGLLKLARPCAPDRVFGAVLLGLGIWLQLYELDVVHEWPGDYFLPLVLLVLGGILVMGGLHRRAAPPADPDSWIQGLAFWSALKRANASQDFRGGELTAIMGGIELDLRQAKIREGQAVIHVFALWGGIELRVPKEWRVDLPLVALLGGYDDKTDQSPAPDAPVLVIKGSAIMAGLEIKN
jgi:LiaF transmembrane domain